MTDTWVYKGELLLENGRPRVALSRPAGTNVTRAERDEMGHRIARALNAEQPRAKEDDRGGGACSDS
jgi:hypothetical protein